MTKYKVAIVDDEKLLRQGMKLILEQGNKIEVTNEAENGRELLDQIECLSQTTIQELKMSLGTIRPSK